jgi:hypothetical protein
LDLSDRIVKKKAPSLPHGVDNFGFDNEDNEYITQEGSHFAYRYEIILRLGRGAFG